MSQHYSDPERAKDPHALPDIEVFYVEAGRPVGEFEGLDEGWYWWTCLPGCMPDSDPVGPFASAEDALNDATDISFCEN